MKIETNKVFVKRGRESTAISAQDITIDGVTLGAMLFKLEELRKAYDNLTEELKGCYVIKKDSEYIVEVGHDLKQIKGSNVYGVQSLKHPLSMYTIKNGEIVVDKKKVGVL